MNTFGYFSRRSGYRGMVLASSTCIVVGYAGRSRTTNICICWWKLASAVNCGRYCVTGNFVYACSTNGLITRKSSYCFQRVLAIAILSVRPSVCLFVTRVDQSKAVQARITKFSPSGAWKTLVLGTVKLFHKFKGGHPERRR